VAEKVEEKESGGIRVFVYGTLKKGRYNHYLLQGATYLGRTVIHGKFTMCNLTHYPGVVRASDSDDSRRPILGEVYLVSEEELAALDLLEGHPAYFRREKILTPWKNAWMYFLPADYKDEFAPIEDGIWDEQPEERAFWDGEHESAA